MAKEKSSQPYQLAPNSAAHTLDYGPLAGAKGELLEPVDRLYKAGFRRIGSQVQLDPNNKDDGAHGLLFEKAGGPLGGVTQFWLNKDTADQVEDFLEAVAPKEPGTEEAPAAQA